MVRQIINGQVYWVDENTGEVVGMAQGGFGGAEPGISNDRYRDIMSRLPDADVVGLVGPGVVPGGEKAVGAQRVAADDAAGLNSQPAPAPDYRPLAGAATNNRGNIQIVPILTSSGQGIVQVASVIETPKNNGEDAEVIAVQLGLVLSQLLQSDPNYSDCPIGVKAIINWGIGNAQFQAICDWNQGTSFAVAASFLRVSAQVDAIPPLLQPDTDITLLGSLGYGNANTLNVSSPLRFTQDVGTRSGGAFGAFQLTGGETSAVFTIPPWAVGFTIIDAGPVVGGPIQPDYTIFLGDRNNGGTLRPTGLFTSTDRSNKAEQVEGQFPIPANARFMTVTNNLGVAVQGTKVIFNLAF